MVLLIALVLISCDGNANLPPSPSPTPTTSVTLPLNVPTPQTPASRFGGPFAIDIELIQRKQAEFEKLKRHGSNLSKEAILTLVLLEDSAKHYRQGAGKRYPISGNERQLYNYVIALDCTIYVAVWQEDATFKRANCNREDSGYDQAVYKENIMINKYPEAQKQGLESSPCWIYVIIHDKTQAVGLLDAMSKHFMLASPTKTVDSYDPNNPTDWILAEVAYAGEIEVTVNGEQCSYNLNNDSGTYKPNGRKLIQVAEHFASKLSDVGPASISDSSSSAKADTAFIRTQTDFNC